FAPDDRLGLERRRTGEHGAAAVPRDVPVLRRRRETVLPAVSALGRHVLRRAVQHRLLCAANPHGGRADRTGGRRLRVDRRRLPHLRQPPRAGAHPAGPRTVPVSAAAAGRARLAVRLPLRRHRDHRLPAPSGHLCARGGVSAMAATPSPPVAGMIWAQANDRVIGSGGTMPWHLPEDLAHFKSGTSGHPVTMGRRTWESLPVRNRPLPGRRNIVVTTDPDWAGDGAERAESPEAGLALAAAGEPEQIWVMGGGTIYQALLPRADVLAVTEIDLDVAG